MKIEYLILRLRDLLGIPFNAKTELSKIGLKAGQTVLDFGCGVGSFTYPAAQFIGSNGKVIALDRESAALAVVRKTAQRKGLANIDIICSDGPTQLDDNSVDLIIFIGVLPYLEDAATVLNELYRVLGPKGVLVTRHCFRISKVEVLERILGTRQFELTSENGHMLFFSTLQGK